MPRSLVFMLFLAGCAGAEEARIPQENAGTAAESEASVTIVPDGGVASSMASAIENLSFQGFARQGPNMITNKWDPQEIQLFITDVDECNGSGVPTRQINFDIYAYALPSGAVAGTYSITNIVNNSTPPAWSTWNLSGFGDLTIQSGTVTLTEVDSSFASGSFSAQVLASDGTAYSMEGSFRAPFCTGQS
jgi:hypothetical protein